MLAFSKLLKGNNDMKHVCLKLGKRSVKLSWFHHHNLCLWGVFVSFNATRVHSSCVLTCLLPSSLTLFLCEMITEALFIFILGFLSFSPCAVGNQSARLLISVNTISQEGWASQSEPPGADWAANGSPENWVPLDTLTCCMSARVAMETLLYREAQWKCSGLRE